MSSPIVSVIIPTYNRAGLIQEALESVLRQTFKDYEIIVVDDGSTDNTPEVLKPYRHRIRYVHQENQGISAARNWGILLSRGAYIAFLDSDDLWYPEKLEKQIAYLEAHPKVGLLYGQILCRTDSGIEKVLPRRVVTSFQELLRESNTIPTSVVVARKKCFESVGLFNASFPVAEDFELWLRVARHFQIDYLRGIVAEYRMHGSNTTQNLEKVYRGYLKVFDKVLSVYQGELEDRGLVRLLKNRVTLFRYLLGTQLLKSRRPQEAIGLIAKALFSNWRLGSLFVKENDPFTKKLFLSAKPYGALLLSIVFGFIPSRQVFMK